MMVFKSSYDMTANLYNGKTKEKTISFYCIALLFFLIFFGGELLGITLGTITFSYYRIALTIIFICLLFSQKLSHYNLLKLPPMIYCVVLWAIVTLFQALLWGIDAYVLKNILLLWMIAAFMLLSVVLIDTQKKLNCIFKVMAFAIFIQLILCLYEMFTGNYFNLSGKNLIHYTVNKNIFGLYIPITYFGNPNNTAVFCFIANFVFLYLARTANKKINLYWFGVLLNLFIWIGTGSRAGYLTIFVFYIVYFILFFPKRINLVLLFIAFMAALILGIIYISHIEIKGNSSDSIRLNLLINGIDILINKTYFLGVGIGNIENFMQNYTNTNGIINMHNWVFEVLVGGGVFVFAVYFIIYIKMIFDLYKLQGNNKRKNIFSRMSIAFLIGFIVSSIGPSSMIGFEFWWAIFAIINVCMKLFKTCK